MAKAKRSQDGLDALMTKLDNLGGFTIAERDTFTRGVAIPSYGERFVRDSNVYLLAGMEMYVGEAGAGKSAYLLHVGKQYLRAGGGFVYAETENKFSDEFIRVNMGEHAYSRRFRVLPTTTMYLPGKKRARSAAERDADQLAWMDTVRNLIMDLRTAGKEGPPVYIGIDSLMGNPSDDLSAKVDDGGYSSLQALGPQQALRIGKWYTEMSALLSGTNITVGVTNHLKKAVSMDGQPIYGSDVRYPGGSEPKFRSNLVLLFHRGGKEVTVESSGRNVIIKVDKNSNGNENRSIKLSFAAENLLDANGDVVVDSEMNAFRRLRWKWAESTANVLLQFFSSDVKDRLGSEKYRKSLSVSRVGTQNNYRYSVPKWGLEGVTDEELDRHINESPEARKDLNVLILTSINSHRGVICQPMDTEELLDGAEGAATLEEASGRPRSKRKRKEDDA